MTANDHDTPRPCPHDLPPGAFGTPRALERLEALWEQLAPKSE